MSSNGKIIGILISGLFVGSLLGYYALNVKTNMENKKANTKMFQNIGTEVFGLSKGKEYDVIDINGNKRTVKVGGRLKNKSKKYFTPLDIYTFGHLKRRIKKILV